METCWTPNNKILFRLWQSTGDVSEWRLISKRWQEIVWGNRIRRLLVWSKKKLKWKEKCRQNCNVSPELRIGWGPKYRCESLLAVNWKGQNSVFDKKTCQGRECKKRNDKIEASQTFIFNCLQNATKLGQSWFSLSFIERNTVFCVFSSFYGIMATE